ncbi:hypothetical protein A2865_00260 [Candidatus Woesebacteria bacterium RIFCSPHIGHO2_01_FULL_39_17]|uniref:UPF0102 protein UT40_C0003G0007 n=3 Tax=Candidatus Woeseibacteriota TaxID=1752722 RepID=A0A0G0QVA6_9BACT|nr:MAG: hypothetical protein US72_C0005G0006 [Microgenomates group bacterium GW2011_GWC1_38_12]KKQ94201.1 MAG: hypothetical protein UT19_C0003G0006 [Candidatus Woesebacteria bacterium GW2011_GWB1_39_10b]KKR14265.1 MAG: hypothetical protein UT40_C0003G0007 [Candidatus Woesebacteria bacterium GW2011_GWA1_39_21b]OGM23665.1 MAG: hypothetical protein A2865_00260 [Candidatus Woesebacteria bacterium RIFCSPHIGHO2_01_FULL_39_17]OGM65487.1 MAG: hypothetical protein A3A52_01000 [Candidatus Woesebacteria b
MKGKRLSGDIGEEYAVGLLKEHNYKILERNFRTKVGEIDIIAEDRDTLVFVEVKTRWSKKYGKPEEAVNKRKLYRIKRAGDYYLLTHKNVFNKQRIDVVAIEVNNKKVSSAKIIKVV